MMGAARRGVERFKVSRDAIIVGALAVSLAALAGSTVMVLTVREQNARIRALTRGEDVIASIRHDRPELIEARASFLLGRDRKEEAQSLLDLSAASVDPATRSRMLFNHANARVRDAIDKIEKGQLDAAIPLVMLAKEQFRQALRLDPTAWDIKHNYDVAMRLVRDFPGYETEAEDAPPDAPKQLWTDLPGVPKGEP